MKKHAFLLAGCALLLSGCAGVKSTFDCDATTSDTCMTMSKANQLAKDKAAKSSGKQAAGGLPSVVNLPAPAVIHSVAPAPQGDPVAVKQTSFTTSTPVLSGQPVASPRAAGSPSSAVMTATKVTPSCRNVRCDSLWTVPPQRTQDRVATVWIAPWVDSDNAFHQPGRVSFVVSAAEWVLPHRVN